MHVIDQITPGILRVIYNEIPESGRSCNSQEVDKGLMHYALSHGDPSMYLDLHAAINGNKPQYDTFFDAANCVIENGSGVTPYHYGELQVLIPAQTHLTSIAALYSEICQCVDVSNDDAVRNAPYPSKQLL